MACIHGSARRGRGQAIAEFALVVPVLMAVIGGIIQFGFIFWAQNTLTQVVRDTGRWEVTQQTPGGHCPDGTAALGDEANKIAASSSLLGYSTAWSISNVGNDANVASYVTDESIAVAWTADSDPNNEGCPPQDNQAVWHVTIRINHTVPTFFPGMQYLPGLGTCDAKGCHIMLSSTAQFRMEPAPAP